MVPFTTGSFLRAICPGFEFKLFPPSQIEEFRKTLPNDEQKLGADIIRKALPYPLRLIANNAGVNGSVVMQKVLDGAADNINFGYNAATDKFEDLMEAGIIDPTKVLHAGFGWGDWACGHICTLHGSEKGCLGMGKLTHPRYTHALQVVRCTLENAVSVAKTFLLADVVVTEIPEREKPMPGAGGAGEFDY